MFNTTLLAAINAVRFSALDVLQMIHNNVEKEHVRKSYVYEHTLAFENGKRQ
jgi:hypothetical protein